MAGWLIAAAGTLGTCVTAAAAVDGVGGWRPVASAAVLAACLTVSGLAWWQSCAGRLHWGVDGAWRWQDAHSTAGEEEGGTLTLAADLQRWMLLRWHPAQGGGYRWLWVEARRDPPRWRALRRAVYSPAGVDAASARSQGRPPAAES